VRKDYLAKHVLTHRQTFRCAQCAYTCHDEDDIGRHVADAHHAVDALELHQRALVRNVFAEAALA
jgi:hypothetical protein